MNHRGLVVAGLGSGSGKTITTMALLAGLLEKNYRVHPFKCGPDFIDPRHHEWITGTPAGNLDLFFTDPQALRERFDRMIEGSPGGVVEGVMGIFDGSERGTSTYDIARSLELPVILVLSAQGMAETVAAVVKGILSHRQPMNVLGIIATRTGSERHRSLISDALEAESLPPLLGVLPRNDSLSLPERYLGLAYPGEQGDEKTRLFRESLFAATKGFDWDRILTAFGDPSRDESGREDRPEDTQGFYHSTRQRVQAFYSNAPTRRSRRTLRVGVALDEAFWFYYPENWESFSRAGIQLEFYSPLRDRSLPKGCHGLYLGGGYPERYFAELAENIPFLKEMRSFCLSGGPVYAECGGMLYLTEGPLQQDNDPSSLVGFFPFRYSLGERLKRLGYAELEASSGFFTGSRGSIRGHLFHYSRLTGEGTVIDSAFRHTADNRPEGFTRNGVVASYAHLYFPSNDSWMEAWAEALKQNS